MLSQEERRFLAKIAFMSMWHGMVAEGERIFSALAATGSKSVGVQLGLAQVFMHKGAFDVAKQYIDEAYDIDKDDEHVHLWQSLYNIAVGNKSQARDDLKVLVENTQNDVIRTLVQNLLQR